MENILTTNEVAARVGLSSSRIRKLIADGILPAEKVGRDNLIRIEDLNKIKGRKNGRPKKEQVAK